MLGYELIHLLRLALVYFDIRYNAMMDGEEYFQ